MNLIIFVLTVFILFFAVVLGIVLIKHYSVKDATIMCKDFCKEVFKTLFASTPAPEPVYPTLVGYAEGHFVLQFVDESFSKVRGNFSTCYCVKAQIAANGSYVYYHFAIQRKPDSLDDDALLLLIQKEAEEALAMTMRMYDCYIPAEPLTVVGLFPHSLDIVFARNETGVKAVENMKHSIRKRKHVNSTIDNTSMTEKWKEEDDERR